MHPMIWFVDNIFILFRKILMALSTVYKYHNMMIVILFKHDNTANCVLSRQKVLDHSILAFLTFDVAMFQFDLIE